MRTVNVGRSGLRVSQICLGTMVFGSQRDEPASFAILDRAAELGIDFIDVADVYPVPAASATWGRTEEIVGKWLQGRGRSAFVVATKCVGRVGFAANDEGGSRKHVIEACEASLRRLRTDRIDLYYLHHSDLKAPIEETLEALDRLVQAGKIHYIALSNFEAWQVGLAMGIAGERRLARVTALQPRYNLLNRSYERDLLPLARAAGLGVIPYNPLGAGMLTGKYRRGMEPPAESRFAQGEYGVVYRGRYWNDAMFGVAEAVVETAREEGCTPAQLALAWLLAQDGVTSPIVGASRPEQLDDSVKAVDLKPSEATLKKLDEVSAAFR
jgi:aryl-alcohol dehydrogenase-like predicted oxidoreductase